YSLMIGGTILIFMLIRSYGETLTAVAASVTTTGHGASPAGVIGQVLLALLVIIVLARLLGNAFRMLHQPPVIGEIIAGILLGPSFLARVAPALSAYLLPA